MLRKPPILLGLFLVLLSACSSNTFTFTGESDYWSAELKVTQHSNDYENQAFELRYKGSNISSVGNITFEVDTNAGGFSGSGYTLDENGVLRSSEESNPTNVKIIENSDVEVTMEWGDSTETIIIKNN